MDSRRRDAFRAGIRAATSEARNLLLMWREMTDEQHDECMEDVQELALLVADLEQQHNEVPFTWTDFLLVSILAGSIICCASLMNRAWTIVEL
jgi:hypoxanthine-guanine phosphoribosyltransferase